MVALPALADHQVISSSLELKGGYNDNILFDRTNPVADSFLAVAPEINLETESEKYSLNLDDRFNE